MTAASGPAPVAIPVRTTENCRFCWMCRHVCPVGQVTRLETHTPHAWALTIESVRRGQLSWNAEAVAVMYACADCGLCRTHCVTDQPLPDAIAAARAEIVGAGAAPLRVYELQELFERYANPYAPIKPADSSTRTPIALWVGDAGRHLDPAAADAALALLHAAGIEARPIGVGRSTGWLASSLGLIDTARRLAEAAVAELRAAGVRELFVLSTGDAWAFGHVYGTRLNVAWPDEIVVRDPILALAEAAAKGRLKFRPAAEHAPYAYHDACHAPRIHRDAAAPRALLAQALGASAARALFWRAERAQPCGAVGGLEFIEPRIANALTSSRFQDAAEAGAAVLISDDPTCAHHLAAQRPADIAVRGLYSMLLERLDG